MSYIVPVIIISVFILGLIKKVPLFDTAIEGIREAIELTVSVLPYLIALFILIEIFRVSGLSALMADVLSTPLSYLGIPSEIVELLVLKPISGSGSMVALENIYKTYGADSYVGRVASVISASSDTIVYVTAVYFSTLEDKRSGAAVPISLVATLIGTVTACFIVRYI